MSMRLAKLHCRSHNLPVNQDSLISSLISVRVYYTGMFPVGDTSSGTLIAVCVCVSVCQCVRVSADISLYCAKNDSIA